MIARDKPTFGRIRGETFYPRSFEISRSSINSPKGARKFRYQATVTCEKCIWIVRDIVDLPMTSELRGGLHFQARIFRNLKVTQKKISFELEQHDFVATTLLLAQEKEKNKKERK